MRAFFSSSLFGISRQHVLLSSVSPSIVTRVITRSSSSSACLVLPPRPSLLATLHSHPRGALVFVSTTDVRPDYRGALFLRPSFISRRYSPNDSRQSLKKHTFRNLYVFFSPRQLDINYRYRRVCKHECPVQATNTGVGGGGEGKGGTGPGGSKRAKGDYRLSPLSRRLIVSAMLLPLAGFAPQFSISIVTSGNDVSE